jgi:hypothetical protein
VSIKHRGHHPEASTHGYDFKGPKIAIPESGDVYPMADVPPGGFNDKDSTAFDRQYSQLLRQLEAAWQEGNGDGTSTNLEKAISAMGALQTSARQLLKKGKPAKPGPGIVGPSFQYRP